jgi:hypothetical protein
MDTELGVDKRDRLEIVFTCTDGPWISSVGKETSRAALRLLPPRFMDEIAINASANFVSVGIYKHECFMVPCAGAVLNNGLG